MKRQAASVIEQVPLFYVWPSFINRYMSMMSHRDMILVVDNEEDY